MAGRQRRGLGASPRETPRPARAAFQRLSRNQSIHRSFRLFERRRPRAHLIVHLPPSPPRPRPRQYIRDKIEVAFARADANEATIAPLKSRVARLEDDLRQARGDVAEMRGLRLDDEAEIKGLREDLEERTRGFEIECEEKEERIKERDELATQLEFLEAELDGVRAAEVRVNQSDYSPYDPTRSRVGRRFSRTRLDFFGLDGRLSSSSPFVARQPHDATSSNLIAR